MDMLEDMMRVIKAERDGRLEALKTEDPYIMSDIWLFTDEPVINELCLMLLVAIRHHFEKELILIAARVTKDGRTLGREEYLRRVKEKRFLPRNRMSELFTYGSVGGVGHNLGGQPRGKDCGRWPQNEERQKTETGAVPSSRHPVFCRFFSCRFFSCRFPAQDSC
jgi:hypothetical protein